MICHTSIPHGLPTSRLGEEKNTHDLQSMEKQNLSPLQKSFDKKAKWFHSPTNLPTAAPVAARD
jgi:hypothetical protein